VAENNFDDLARSFAEGEISRRGALRKLGGAFAGFALASLGIGCEKDVTAPTKKLISAPKSLAGIGDGNSDCAAFCDAIFPPGPLRGECKSAAAHGVGLCPQCNADVGLVCNLPTGGLFCCGSGQTCCGTICVDLQTNPANCGSCGHVCIPGALCTAGQCVCPPGTSACANGCQNLATDINNCGACGLVCLNGQFCSGGECVCPDGLTNCRHQCVSLGVDVQNCGGCGITCGFGQICSSGQCITPCDQIVCGGRCCPPATTYCVGPQCCHQYRCGPFDLFICELCQ
jgi:hypothetical protein